MKAATRLANPSSPFARKGAEATEPDKAIILRGG